MSWGKRRESQFERRATKQKAKDTCDNSNAAAPLITVTPPPRSETRTAIDNLDRLLHWGGGEGETSQDWDLVMANSTRLGEFCDLYGSGSLDMETKFALMMLIVASWDDALQDRAAIDHDEGMDARIERLLRQDFVLHLHNIRFRSLFGEADPRNVFAVTPMLRRIWADCFESEYQPWLEHD